MTGIVCRIETKGNRKMVYVMGFVVAVPGDNRDAYARHASDAMPYFREHGALRMVEAWGDDVPHGERTDFHRAVDARDGESVVFSWQEFPDKPTADAASAAMAEDQAMDDMASTMPFDATRMIWGGFEVLLDRRAEGRTGYVDGSVLPVPADRRAAYLAAYEPIADLLMAHGALRAFDGWGDIVPAGEKTDFLRAVAATGEETVVFSFVEWPDKATRDAAWQVVYASIGAEDDAGFDESRRIFGGFVPLIDL